MKTLARAAASAAAIALAAAAIARLCWQPWLCNREEWRLERQITATVDMSDVLSIRIVARDNLPRIEHCIETDPTNVSRYMLKAAVLRMLGRPADAADAYRAAMRVDRRPELWFHLGESQLAARQVEPALQNLKTMGLLTPYRIYEVPEPYLSRIITDVTANAQALELRRPLPIPPHELRLRLERDPW
jgi:hypothetical protein